VQTARGAAGSARRTETEDQLVALQRIGCEHMPRRALADRLTKTSRPALRGSSAGRD
jgi:hypothetical protein